MQRAVLAVVLLALAVAAPISDTDLTLTADFDSSIPRLVASWEEKSAAVTYVLNSTAKPTLLTTTYGIQGSEPMYAVSDLEHVKAGEQAEVVQLVDNLLWANFVEGIPDSVFNQSSLLLTAGGFLTPGHTTGHVTVIDISDSGNPSKVIIAAEKNGYFYHKVVLADIDQDGLVDVLGARATVPTLPWKSKQGELVWFRHPGSGALNGTVWEEHVLISGPDVGFLFEDLNNDGIPEVIATQFFTAKQLAVYSCTKGRWSDCDSDSIDIHVIDTNGPFFDAQYVDLNGDGKKDLLVTNNRDDGKGAVFAYEVPANPLSDAYPCHQISQNFTVHKSIMPGKGAPGQPTAFYPRSTDSGKPSVVVSGDDSGVVALLNPTSKDTSSWDYIQTNLVQAEAKTIGSISVADVDGDGLMEIFVPHYSEGKVEMYAYTS